MIDFTTLVVLCFLSMAVGAALSRRYPVVKTIEQAVERWYVPYALLMLIPGSKTHNNGGIVIPIGDEKYHITDDNIYQIITIAGVEDEVEADPNRVLGYAEKVAASRKAKSDDTKKQKQAQAVASNGSNGNGKLPDFLRPARAGHRWLQDPDGNWVELPL